MCSSILYKVSSETFLTTHKNIVQKNWVPLEPPDIIQNHKQFIPSYILTKSVSGCNDYIMCTLETDEEHHIQHLQHSLR